MVQLGHTKRSGRMIIVDPTAGLSGDMFLAGLFALGAEPRRVTAEVKKLPGLEPFRIVSSSVKSHGIAARRARVVCGRESKERDLGGILGMIERSRLDLRIKELSSRVFGLLGGVEGSIHGVPAGRVHFHEVGAVDSIVDIVGAVVALSHLGFPSLYHRPFRLGSGKVGTSHGELPVPAPATLALLEGRSVRFTEERGEVVTPTGAALMKALAGELPEHFSVTPKRIVYAVGTRRADQNPGMLRLIEAEQAPIERDILAVRTSIDDMNPEIYQRLQDRLFETGALEVYLTQLVMKKGRPGVLVTVLCERSVLDAVIDTLFEETTTLGVRISSEGRVELERWTEDVATGFGTVKLKRGRLRDGTIKSSPEYESCRAVALKENVPIIRVYREAASAGAKIGSRERAESGGTAGKKTKRNTGRGGSRGAARSSNIRRDTDKDIKMSGRGKGRGRGGAKR
jgi:uncharacterized protein (TIGR00299 family) protein